MIWPTDAAKLAYTKLKTRKIRLTITVIISSLLFGLLLGAAFTVRGAVSSIESLSKTGLGSRFILTASSSNFFGSEMNDPELIAQAEALQKDIEARKKAEAKRLGIEYDARNDKKLVEEFDTPMGKQKTLNMQQLEVMRILAARMAGQPGGKADFEKLARKHGATNIYSGVASNGFTYEPSFTVLKDGKEEYEPKQQFGPQNQNSVEGIASQWQSLSTELMKPFLLQGQNLALGKDGSLPVVAPYSAAEQLAGFKALPDTASAKERLERLKAVRSRAAGQTFTICYRNSASRAEVQNAVSQQQELTRNKDNKDYQKPSLIYDVPAEPCGPVRVVRDVRTAEEKRLDAKQQEFRRAFGEQPPESSLQALRIVGINSDIEFGGVSVDQVLQAIVMSNLGMGWFSPLEAVQASPTASKIYGLDAPGEKMIAESYFMEVASADAARAAISAESCQPDYTPQSGGFEMNYDPFKACKEAGKYFALSAYGSNSVALDSFKKTFSKIFTIATLVIAAIAAVVMMGTVGRIIADSRRETAVFRAIGAKRSDISQIYLTYTVMVACLIIATSFIGGVLMALYLESRYSDELTVSAAVAFNVSDLNHSFNMVTLPLRDIAVVSGFIILASLLAASLPLLANVRRNPIRDMRDER